MSITEIGVIIFYLTYILVIIGTSIHIIRSRKVPKSCKIGTICNELFYDSIFLFFFFIIALAFTGDGLLIAVNFIIAIILQLLFLLLSEYFPSLLIDCDY